MVRRPALWLQLVAAAAAPVAGVVAVVTGPGRELGEPVQFRPTAEQRRFVDEERQPYETLSDTIRRIFDAGMRAIRAAGRQP